MTLETLSAVKNPPIIAKQANIAHGPQQVNNRTPVRAKRRPAQSKVLEPTNEIRMDPGAPGKAGFGNSELATVGALNGAKN